MLASNLLSTHLNESFPATESYRSIAPCCIWLTGLSGAGKSTIANTLHNQLSSYGLPVVIIDGDLLREGLNKNLGFSREDRSESVRRAAEVAKLMQGAGLIVIVALISPFREDREKAKMLFLERTFIEVFVNTDLQTCEDRDPKMLYKKARQGLIPEFTGISSPYEPPHSPCINLLTHQKTPEQCVHEIIQHLSSRVF